MATITQTLETLTFTAKAPKQKQEMKSVSFCTPDSDQTLKLVSKPCPPDCVCHTLEPECSPDCPCKTVCPPGCTCKSRSSKTLQMVFYAVGVIVAVLAMYLMVSTDSKLYLVFWVVYSVLRRMMLQAKRVTLKAKTD